MDMQNLTKLDDKHFEIRFSYEEPLTGERHEVRRRFRGELEDARQRRDELKAAAKSGEYRDGPEVTGDRPTVGDFYDEFDERRQGRGPLSLAPSTYDKAQSRLECHVLPVVEDWIIEEIEIADLNRLTDQWSRKRKKDGEGDYYSPYTVNGWIRDARKFLKFCFRQVGRATDILGDWDPLPERGGGQSGRAMTETEEEKFWPALRGHSSRWYRLSRVLRDTGLRFGAVSALTVDDVDFSGDRILFTKTHHRGNVTAGLKGGRDKVTLPLTADLRLILLEQMEAATDLAGPDELVFPADSDPETSPRDGYLGTETINSAMEKAADEAGIPKVTPHDLRRTFVSRAMEAGYPPERIKAVTGHCSEMLDGYYRPSDDGIASMMNTINTDSSG